MVMWQSTNNRRKVSHCLQHNSLYNISVCAVLCFLSSRRCGKRARVLIIWTGTFHSCSTCIYFRFPANEEKPPQNLQVCSSMTSMSYCRAKNNKLSIINSSILLAVPSFASAFWFTNLMSIRRNNRLFHFISSSVLLVFVWTSLAIEDLMVLYGYSLYIRTYIQYQSVFVPYGHNYHHTRPYSQCINMQEHTTSQNTDIYLEDPS
jgi:hypothetical protein